jgi:hypothetical protein
VFYWWAICQNGKSTILYSGLSKIL